MLANLGSYWRTWHQHDTGWYSGVRSALYAASPKRLTPSVWESEDPRPGRALIGRFRDLEINSFRLPESVDLKNRNDRWQGRRSKRRGWDEGTIRLLAQDGGNSDIRVSLFEGHTDDVDREAPAIAGIQSLWIAKSDPARSDPADAPGEVVRELGATMLALGDQSHRPAREGR